MSSALDIQDLETKVKEMYRQVAEAPDAGYHFELGRPLAHRLGYDPERLAAVPSPAVDSFAGVGFFFDKANLQPGESVVDLGSGAGMDAFYAATLVGPGGSVTGIDFTPAQLAKARGLAASHQIEQVQFLEGRITAVPLPDASVDCIISNGVINLCPDKAAVFREAARLLRPGGRLACADIVTEQPLGDAITCNADLWASCIGGAAHEDDYRNAIEAGGLRLITLTPNPYAFLSAQALGASRRYGVKSVSVLAVKPA
jgi:SAM-dependent methyltransferase